MKRLYIEDTLQALQKIPSATGGWDAVLVLDQFTINAMLWQQYAERLVDPSGEENYYIELPGIDFVIDDDKNKTHLFGFTVSAPRMSFEGSSVDAGPTCRITLDAIGGFVVSTAKAPNEPRRVTNMMRVLPTGGHELSFTQRFVEADVVEGSGLVVVPMEKATAFYSSFIVEGFSEVQMTAAFNHYLALLNVTQSYVLGKIAGLDNGNLTPKNFSIRTITPEPEETLETPKYGDGAIMLSITFKGGEDGSKAWGDGAPYPLPLDYSGTPYSSALYISRKKMFDSILRDALVANIGSGVDFAAYTDSEDDPSLALVSNAGYTSVTPFSRRDVYGANNYHAFFHEIVTLSFSFSEGTVSKLLVRSTGSGFKFTWTPSPTVADAHLTMSDNLDFPHLDYDYYSKITVNARVDIPWRVGFSDIGAVEFIAQQGEVNISVVTDISPGDFLDAVKGYMNSLFLYPFIRGSLAPLNTLYLSNLIFPGDSTLAMSEVYMPNDLLLLGTVKKKHKTFEFPVNNSIVGRNDAVSFAVPAGLRNADMWGVEVNGKTVVGEHLRFDPVSGEPTLYTDFDEADMGGGLLTIKVTIVGTLDGEPAKGIGLVHVLKRGLSFDPLYFSCTRKKTVELSAASLSGGTVEWKILTEAKTGSTLTAHPTDPNKRIYTAGSADDSYPYSFEVIEVKASGSWGSEVEYIRGVLINKSMNLVVGYDHDPAAKTMQFKLLDQDGTAVIEPAWTLLHGPGEVTAGGFYREPQAVNSDDFIVVSGSKLEDMGGGVSILVCGFLVIPLPLSKYVDIVAEDVEEFCSKALTH